MIGARHCFTFHGDGVWGRWQIDEKGSFFPIEVQYPTKEIRQVNRIKKWYSISFLLSISEG